MVRDGLKRVINEQDDMEVIAEAGNGDEALRLVDGLGPNVALLDVSLPGRDGRRSPRNSHAGFRACAPSL
jgi:DNA-binding NarL/FixJ family response regulator